MKLSRPRRSKKVPRDSRPIAAPRAPALRPAEAAAQTRAEAAQARAEYDDLVHRLRDANERLAAQAAQAHTLAAERPDVLVSDIGLPDEDGYALIRYIRQHEAEHGGVLPAVALTGYVRAEDRARVFAAGFQAHVAKPVDPVELMAAIAAVTNPLLDHDL